jgi:hypothetical protein
MNLSELEYRDFLFEKDDDLYMGRVFFTGSIHGPEGHFRLCAQVVFSKTGLAGIVKDFQRHVFNHIKDINEERKNAKEQN